MRPTKTASPRSAAQPDGNVTMTVVAQDDRDRYDRLLRYVNITEDGGALADIGLAMIDLKFGDRPSPLDGYGSHPLEGRLRRRR